MEHYRLKKFISRKLKDGNYVIVGNGTKPIVIDYKMAQEFQYENFDALKDVKIQETFKECGFFTSRKESDFELNDISEDKTSSWKLARIVLFTIGLISLIVVISLFFLVGVPTGKNLIPADIDIWRFLVFIIVFYIPTVIMHEFMHMLFGKTLSQKYGGLGVNISKNVAYVSLNHIWSWSLFSRISALSAGLILDLSLLAISLMGQYFTGNWMFTTSSVVLLYKIIWQFQFYKNCDGRLIALSILDNPFLHIDALDKNAKNKDINCWRKLTFLGYFIKIILVLFWVAPILFTLFGLFMQNFSNFI